MRDKARENLKLLAIWVERFRTGGDVEYVVDLIDEYSQIYLSKTGCDLSDASIFEIGFGARPLRLMALQGMGFNAAGVDLERPATDFSLREIARILHANGLERALKSALRSLLFDRRESRALEKSLAARGALPVLYPDRLMIGDASELELAEASVDLIVSEDVFEHIRPEALEALIPKMATWLRPGGLALISPMVYTGISGSHLIDWYPYRVLAGRIPRGTDPWEHLRRNRVSANTYLNKLTRSQYRALFGLHFFIEEERERYPNLGRALLSPMLAAELAGWPDDELFSNGVQFVLRPRSASL